jgi:hypothetical protein
MTRRHSGRIRGAFVPVLKDTMKADAWRAMSHGARSLFIALHCRYNYTTENAAYLAARKASLELGSHTNQITRWYRELQHFGFIRMVSPAYLGLAGKGRAAHWRLTDVPHAGQPATQDFLRWDGSAYHEQKKPESYLRKPVLENTDTASSIPRTPPSSIPRTPTRLTVLEKQDIEPAAAVLEKQDITSLPLGSPSEGAAAVGDGLDIPEFLRREVGK